MEKEKISKKIQILNASEQLFFNYGFDGTSTRNIAKISKVNMAMINYYFGSKEGLFTAVIVRMMQDFGVQMIDIDRKEINTKDKFYLVTALYAERILMRPEMFRVIYREINTVRSVEMVDIISDRIYQNYNAMTQILLKGIQEDVFKEVDVRMVMATIQGIITQIVLAPKKINEVGGTLLETEAQRISTTEKVKQHIKLFLDTFLIK